MPRVSPDAFRIPLTSLLIGADDDVTSIMRAFAASLTRQMSKTFHGTQQPTVAEIDRMAAWTNRTIGELFGQNAADVEKLYHVPGTYPNVVRLNVVRAADAAADPIVSRSVAQLQSLGVDVSQSSLVRGISNPPQILSSRNWIDPNGQKLSTRVWKSGDDIFRQIDSIMRYEFSRGASPTRLADQLEQFLTAEGAKSRTAKLAGRTGRVGSYAARRLVRTELSRAHGNAVMLAADADPFTAGVRWNLGFLHPSLDSCDSNASANSYGLGKGVYPTTSVPRYPDHPHCLCYLSTIDANDRERIRYGATHNLVDLSGLDSSEIVEQVTGFVNVA